MTDFERARRAMVDSQLQANGVFDHRILSAMGKVPREEFVPANRRAVAYIDDSHPFDENKPLRRLPPPAAFGRLIQLAEVNPTDRVLVVGTGTGYSAAVLSKLAGSVVGLEPDPELAAQAGSALAKVGAVNVEIVNAAFDAPPKGTFDVILIEGAVTEVPPALLRALGEGGRLACMIVTGPTAVAHLYRRRAGAVTARAEFNATMPPLHMTQKTEQFIF
jgi:protein-L-isoaspartate(D-aspartate) O-methyltransferase